MQMVADFSIQKVNYQDSMCLGFLKGTFAFVGTWRGIFEPSTTTQATERKLARKKLRHMESGFYNF